MEERWKHDGMDGFELIEGIGLTLNCSVIKKEVRILQLCRSIQSSVKKN